MSKQQKVFVVEAVGSVICCTRTVSKAHAVLYELQDEIASLDKVRLHLAEDDAYGYYNDNDDLYSIVKTILK